MSIGLTDSELNILSSIDTSSELEALDYQLSHLQDEKSKLSSDSTVYKKIYDWWTLLCSYSELEEQWEYGNYVSSQVTDTIIENSAKGEDTILFPYSSESYDKLYPKRVPALYGTDSTAGNGSCEYVQIIEEEDATTIGDKQQYIDAQISALENHIIPNLQSFINECESESGYSSDLSSIISNAKQALADASTAYSDATNARAAYPSYPSNRASFISSRKTQIENRVSWIHSNHSILYDKRYLWLDFRINRSYGIDTDYYSIDDTIAILNNQKSAVENKSNEIDKIT